MDWMKRIKVNKYAGIAALFATVATASGCLNHSQVRMPSDEGYFEMSGDARGVRAAMDGMSALVTNGKASPDIKSAAWQHREAEDKEITTRDTAPGFMGKLFGGGK